MYLVEIRTIPFTKGDRVRFIENGYILEGTVKQIGNASREGDQVQFVTPVRAFNIGTNTLSQPRKIFPRLFTNGEGLILSTHRRIPC